MHETNPANPRLTLAQEEQKELSIGLFREWWIAVTQAFADAAGTMDALDRLKPHFHYAGKAGRRFYQKNTGLSFPDGLVTACAMGYAFVPCLGGKFALTYAADDGSGIGEMLECKTHGVCKEACLSVCSYLWGSSLQETDPDYEIQLVRSMGDGDPCCQWLVSKKGQRPKVAATEAFRIPSDRIFRDPLDDTTKEYLGYAYSSGFWIEVTKIFNDLAGPEVTLARLRPLLYRSGMSLGTRLSDRLKAHENNVGSIVELVCAIQDLHRRKGEIMTREDQAECVVAECPFSGSPPEICMQYEAFFNGVCEAIDPSLEFSYDRMMTKGDKACHWTIRKKGEFGVEAVREEKSKASALRALTMKYAHGEVTKKEYDEMKAILEGIETER